MGYKTLLSPISAAYITTSTSKLTKALRKYYNALIKKDKGKGSHIGVYLPNNKKPIILRGNSEAISPHIIKQVIEVIKGEKGKNSDLSLLLKGKL